MAGDSRFQTLRAVLVEPSAVQAKIIRAECDEIGLHQVEHVATVAEALDTMLRRAPDLILSALYLPDGTGTELVEAMRAEGLMLRRYEDYTALAGRSSNHARMISTVVVNFSVFVQQLVTIGVVIWGVHLIGKGDLTMGALIASVAQEGLLRLRRAPSS